MKVVEYAVQVRSATPAAKKDLRVKVGDFSNHYGSVDSWGPLSGSCCFSEKGARQSMARIQKLVGGLDTSIRLDLGVVPVTLSVEE